MRVPAYLDDAHVESRFLRQLFADVAGGLRGGSESSLERFQLLGLDGGAWSTSLRPHLAVATCRAVAAAAAASVAVATWSTSGRRRVLTDSLC